MYIASLADHLGQLPALARLHHAEWSRVSRFKTVDEHANKLKSRIGQSPIPATYVLLLNQTVAGSVSLLSHDDIDNVRPDLSPWLASLYVEPGHRGRGFGSALVKYCIRRAGHFGYTALYLYTDTHSQYYTRFGWRPIDNRTSRGLDVTVMELQLAL